MILEKSKKEVVLETLEQALNKWLEILRENPSERSLYYPEDTDLDGILQRNKQLVRMSGLRSVASIQQTVDMIVDRNANFLESPETYTANVSDVTNNEGLTDQRISSFQTVKVNEEFCAICISHIKNKFMKKLDCNHFFCTKCIKTWFKNHTTCPVCRRKLKN